MRNNELYWSGLSENWRPFATFVREKGSTLAALSKFTITHTLVPPSLVPRLSPRANEKPYCKRRKAGRGLGTRLSTAPSCLFRVVM